MTKKDLKWRLKDLPTVNEISELVGNKIITAEEAKDLLFNEQPESAKTDEVEALRRQIEFLEDLVKELSKNRPNSIVQSYPIYVEKWIERRSPQYLPFVTYSTSISGAIGPSGNLALSSYAGKLLS